MKAMVLTTHKAPFAAQTIPDPQPGPGQVRLRMRATGVCGTDVHVWNGELPLPLPLVPGHEPVGTVESVGPGVKSPKVGDRVGVSWFQAGCGHCLYCQKKLIKFCAEPKTWIANGGGFAEFMIAEAEGCVPLPAALSWEAAAPAFCGGFSAMSAFRIAKPKPGERIAVLGIGGLGHFAIQIAKAYGHDVVAITNSPDKVNDARQLGAGEVLVVKKDVGQELTEMGGVDIVLSFSPAMNQNSQAIMGLRPAGRLVTTAVSAEPIRVDPVSTLFKQTSVIGSAQNDPADLVDFLQLVAAQKVKPWIETYPIDDLNKVIARLIGGKVRHRAVLVQDA